MGSVLLLFTSGCLITSNLVNCWPLHYRPSCDLSPVLTLPFRAEITSLAGIPRTKSIVEGGFNKEIGEQEWRRDARRELFYFRKGGTTEVGSTEYRFLLFYNEAAAIDEYEWAKKDQYVFHEVTENGLSGRVYYTEQPRADPEGGSVPMGYYVSRADFQLHNLYISVETVDRSKPYNNTLSNAVMELRHMLIASLATTNQTTK